MTEIDDIKCWLRGTSREDRLEFFDLLQEAFCPTCAHEKIEGDCPWCEPAEGLPDAPLHCRTGWASYRIQAVLAAKEELERRIGKPIATPHFNCELNLFPDDERVLVEMNKAVDELWVALGKSGDRHARY